MQYKKAPCSCCKGLFLSADLSECPIIASYLRENYPGLLVLFMGLTCILALFEVVEEDRIWALFL